MHANTAQLVGRDRELELIADQVALAQQGQCQIVLLAGEQAMQVYAAPEAAAHYRVALDLIDSQDPRRGGLLLGFGEAALLANTPADAISAFESAQSWFLRQGNVVAAALRCAVGGDARRYDRVGLWRVGAGSGQRAAHPQAEGAAAGRLCAAGFLDADACPRCDVLRRHRRCAAPSGSAPGGGIPA